MQVKIKNIVVHNKLELIKLLRANLGYTMDNCVKFAARLDENDSMELDEQITYAIHEGRDTTCVTFDYDREEEPIYNPYAYQNDLDYIDAKGWYDSLPETQKEFVRTLARDFVSYPGPAMG